METSKPLSVFAYCGADWRQATAHAAGCRPHTSPGHSADTIAPLLAKAAACHLVYLNLHGFPDQPNLFGQAGGRIGPTALTPQQVSGHDWSGTVVFAEVCFSAASGGGAIARAFLAGGAQAFIGSTSEAYGRARPTLLDGEADRLFWLFRHTYRHITDPGRALIRARKLLRLASFPLDADDRATLKSFICLRSNSHAKQNEQIPIS